MKHVFAAILVSVSLLSGISACATAPSAPVGEGELRLLNLRVPESGTMGIGTPYEFSVSFEADGHPEIKRVCCYWSGDGPYCYRVMNVEYGQPGTIVFSVKILLSQGGPQRLECYADYVQEGKRRRTNIAGSYVDSTFH